MKLIEMMNSRRKYLEEIIESLKPRVSKYSSVESVYAKSHKKGFQYYMKTDKGIKYIKANEKEQAKQIVQHEYESKVIKAAEEEYKKLSALIKVYENNVIEDIYKQMPIGKRVLTNPIELTDEEYIKKWNEQKYEKLAFMEEAPELYSLRGERMRSKSEVIIANLLDKMKINYKYEKPLKLDKLGFVHPDFTLLDINKRKEIYLEHLGMMDDQVYRNNAFNKIRAYERNGYYMGDCLIITMETVNCPLDIKALEKKIKYVMDMK